MPVAVTVPSGWEVKDGLNEADHLGIVAFSPPTHSLETPEQQPSAFLDATSEAVIPATIEAATEGALGADDCHTSNGCVLLDRESFAGGGFLISVKSPTRVFVESWRPALNGRVVRCGAEVSGLSAVRMHPKSWLDDPNAVKGAQLLVTAICRSAHAVP